MGAPKNGGLRLLFDRRLMFESRGAKITTDAGLLAVRKLNEKIDHLMTRPWEGRLVNRWYLSTLSPTGRHHGTGPEGS
jgi:hypothetical protein